MDPIQILQKTMPKPKSTLTLNKITYNQTLKIIKEMKTSNSVGVDNVSSRTLKLIPNQSAMYITHIINCIIVHKTYPEILKISRILPILKQGKNKFDPGSYRPICNLTSIDKVIQEWFRIQIVEYLDENQILSDAHHGSRPGFSTLTAKNTIDYLIGRGSETGKLTMLINTDLSAAYDIVDHELLLKKFEFY